MILSCKRCNDLIAISVKIGRSNLKGLEPLHLLLHLLTRCPGFLGANLFQVYDDALQLTLGVEFRRGSVQHSAAGHFQAVERMRDIPIRATWPTKNNISLTTIPHLGVLSIFRTRISRFPGSIYKKLYGITTYQDVLEESSGNTGRYWILEELRQTLFLITFKNALVDSIEEACFKREVRHVTNHTPVRETYVKGRRYLLDQRILASGEKFCVSWSLGP